MTGTGHVSDGEAAQRETAESGQQAGGMCCAGWEGCLEALPVAAALLSLDGLVVRANAAMCRLADLDAGAICGRPGWTLLPGARNEDEACPMQAMLAVEAAITRVLAESGERYHEVRLAPVRGTDGMTAGALYTVQDVTECERAKGLLQVADGRLRAVIEALPDITYLKDTGGRYLMVNAAFERLVGLSSAEILGRRDAEFLAAELAAQCEEGDRRAMEAGTVHRSHEVMKRADGSEIHFDTLKTPLCGNDRAVCGVLGVSRDVSRQRHVEQQLRARESQLRDGQRLRAVGILAAGVAHEINNPLQGILSFAQLLVDDCAQDKLAVEYARQIEQEAERVARVIRSLLQFAQHETEGAQPVSVVNLVHDTLSLVAAGLRRDQIAIEVNIPDPAPVVAEQGHGLRHALMNLLLNAREQLNHRYVGHDARKRIVVRAEPGLRHGRPSVRLVVEDEGGGVDPESAESIMDPFYTTRTRSEHAGLGLPIALAIAESHGGALWVESDPGLRARAILEIPVDEAR